MVNIEISDQQIDQFKNDGFLILDKLLTEEIIKPCLERIGPLFRGEFETGILPDKVKWLEGKDPDGVPRSHCNVWKADRTLARATLAQGIGYVAAKLMGWKGTRCNQDFIMWIPPGAGTICYHQDNSYQDWNLPGEIVTVWIPLVETKKGGGTLEYVRGSHKWKLGNRVESFAFASDYKKEMEAAAKEAGVNNPEIVHVEIPAGGAAIHHGNLWHGSNYNNSESPRFSISTHCMSSESTFHPTIPSPMFSHYKKFGTTMMEESFFPVIWEDGGKRSSFLEEYLA